MTAYRRTAMTAYEQGFIQKCVYYGIPYGPATSMLKCAARDWEGMPGKPGGPGGPPLPRVPFRPGMGSDRVEPNDDVKYFYDKIIPWLKQNSETAGAPWVDYDAAKFFPRFYNRVPIRYDDTPSNVSGYSFGEDGIVLGTSSGRSASTLVHELKHQQNNDTYRYRKNYNPFNRSFGVLEAPQSGRSKADDALLKRVYGFTPEMMWEVFRIPSGVIRGYAPELAESGATNAEYQFKIMQDLSSKLGRRPTAQEFKQYVMKMPSDEVLRYFTTYVPNGYQQEELRRRHDARDAVLKQDIGSQPVRTDNPEYSEEDIDAIRRAWGNVAKTGKMDYQEKKASFLSFFKKTKPVVEALVPSAGGRLATAKNALRAEMSARLGMKRLSALIPEMKQLRDKGLKGDAFVSAARELGRSRVQPVVESTRDAIVRRLYEIAKRHSFDDDWKGTYSRVSRFGVRTASDNPERVLEEVSKTLRTESGNELGDKLRAAFEHGWKYTGSPQYDNEVDELLSWMPVKKAESYSLKDDPTYEDVLKVFSKLDYDDRANLVPRHPDFFRKVPDDMLFDRQVAIDSDGNPVGFNEFYYERNKLGRRQSPHNSIAVVPEARGNGLARLMVEEAIRKARKEKIKRLVWEAFANNDGSIHAALSSGFEDATPKNAKGYRRLVYRV